jgi:glutamyl-tRNA reductase
MKLRCIGINHRTAAVGIRENMWFSDDEVRSFLRRMTVIGIKECVLASTCNRTELYYIPGDDSADETSVLNELVSYKHAGESVREDNFYSFQPLLAAQHLFKLAAGIDSMVLGDVQILHQLKSAFGLAQETKRDRKSVV